jgi:hypothetical protein
MTKWVELADCTCYRALSPRCHHRAEIYAPRGPIQTLALAGSVSPEPGGVNWHVSLFSGHWRLERAPGSGEGPMPSATVLNGAIHCSGAVSACVAEDTWTYEAHALLRNVAQSLQRHIFDAPKPESGDRPSLWCYRAPAGPRRSAPPASYPLDCCGDVALGAHPWSSTPAVAQSGTPPSCGG